MKSFSTQVKEYGKELGYSTEAIEDYTSDTMDTFSPKERPKGNVLRKDMQLYKKMTKDDYTYTSTNRSKRKSSAKTEYSRFKKQGLLTDRREYDKEDLASANPNLSKKDVSELYKLLHPERKSKTRKQTRGRP